MKTIKIANKVLKTIIFFLLVLLVSGISYAYFISTIYDSEETSTMTASGGVLTITYAGGPNLSANDMMPKNTPFITKNFTITGKNDTTQTMKYNVSLVVDINTFSSNALGYKLTSTNTGSNGTIIPSVPDMNTLDTGASDVLLGNGTFTGTAGLNKVHTYKLELYFPNLDYDQSADQGKQFAAHLETREGIAPTNNYLTDKIIGQYGGATNITEAPASLFENTTTESENAMYTTEDDYGTSYYYRGAKTHVNNNLIFAEHQWKIVRINGDGSIRIIYNGTCPNNSCTINTTGTSTQIGTTAFNSSTNDNKYVGYMFGGPMGSASTSRTQATTNETSSTIKTFLDSWYVSNILGTEYELYLSDTLFCNDRQLQSEVGGAATGTGFGSSETQYATNQRLETTKNPNIKCGLKNDRFTVSDTIKGNGNLIYPVGLLSADEASLAGLKNGTYDTINYLYTNQYWWLSSPWDFSYGDAGWFIVYSDGDLSYTASYYWGGRPVLNLKSETTIQGTGTEISPYIVV